MSRKILPAPSEVSEVQMHAWSDDPADPLYRLTVEREWRREGLVTVAEEQMSSTDRKRARVAEVLCKMVVTGEQAEWIMTALARALGARVDTEDARNGARELVPATIIRFDRVVKGG